MKFALSLLMIAGGFGWSALVFAAVASIPAPSASRDGFGGHAEAFWAGIIIAVLGLGLLLWEAIHG